MAKEIHLELKEEPHRVVKIGSIIEDSILVLHVIKDNRE